MIKDPKILSVMWLPTSEQIFGTIEKQSDIGCYISVYAIIPKKINGKWMWLDRYYVRVIDVLINVAEINKKYFIGSITYFSEEQYVADLLEGDKICERNTNTYSLVYVYDYESPLTTKDKFLAKFGFLRNKIQKDFNKFVII